MGFQQTPMTLEYACGHTETYTMTTLNVAPATEKVPFECPDCWEEQERLDCYVCGGTHSRDTAVITRMGVSRCRTRCSEEPEMAEAAA